MNPSPLRPIAVSRPLPPPRPLRLGLGATEPAAVRHTADFVAPFGPGIVARIAHRSLDFGRRLAVFGGHRDVALPEVSLALRHRARLRQRYGAVERRVVRWPVWAAPPAIGIPARHQHFLGLPVLPEAAMLADEPELFPPFAAPEFAAGIVEPEAPPPILPRPRPERGAVAAARRSALPDALALVVAPAFLPAFTAPAFASGITGPDAPPLILHRPRPERASVAVTGLTAMRRLTDAQDHPAALVSIGDLAARVADQHAVPEMFSPTDVSRSLAASPRVAEGFLPGQTLRQAQGRLFAAAQDGGAQVDRAIRDTGRVQDHWGVLDGTVSRPAHPLPVIPSEAKDLSSREQRRGSEPFRPNFTLDLLRHVSWQPERHAIGAVFGARSAGDARARREAQGIVGPDAGFFGSTGTPQSAAAASPIARFMRIAPVATTLAPPMPPSTLAAPTVDWPSPMPAAVAPSSAWSGSTPAPLLPPFVAARMAQAARITPVATRVGESARPLEVASEHPALHLPPRPGIRGAGAASAGGFGLGVQRVAAAVGQTFASAASFTVSQGAANAGADVPSLSLPPAVVPGELPMVVRRLSFGSERARQALLGTVSPVWGALGRQVVPTIPPSRPLAPATAPLPLPGGSMRDVSRSTASVSLPSSRSASPLFGAFPGLQAPPSGQVVPPVVYRSPVADRAEPTEAQRTEAAEAMAESVGQPLPPLVRRSMEHRFGMDLAAVRLHSGPAVMRAANLVGARAMARGTDVFLPGGVADSSATDEIPLLAHELTHVAQHLGHRVPSAVPAPMTLARHASDEEHAAERIERQFVRRFPSLPGLGSLPTGGLPKLPNLPSLPNLGSLPGGLPNVPSLSSLPDSALTLARPALNAVQQPLQQAGQAAEGMLGKAENAIASVTGAQPPGAAAPNPAQLAEQVYQLLERRLIVERERGGYRR